MVWLNGGAEKVLKCAEKVRISPLKPHHEYFTLQLGRYPSAKAKYLPETDSEHSTVMER